MQCPNDWDCRQCKKPGHNHKQADGTDDLSSNHEDAYHVNSEQSAASDADNKDNEAPQS